MGDRDRQERKAFWEAVEALIEQGDAEDVIALAEVQLRRVPDDPDARIAICRVRIQQGRLAEAREMVGDMEETLASLSRVYACLGDIHRQEGRRESAESCYRKYLLLNPDTPLARELEARLEALAAECEEACDGEMPEEDGEIPADFQTLTLAELYIGQGHLALAGDVLETVLKRDPLQGQAAVRLAEVRAMVHREAMVKRSGAIIGELNRWLSNIGRLRSHAG